MNFHNVKKRNYPYSWAGPPTCNRLNPTMALLKMISTIAIPKTPRSVQVQFLTLVGYISLLPRLSEAVLFISES